MTVTLRGVRVEGQEESNTTTTSILDTDTILLGSITFRSYSGSISAAGVTTLFSLEQSSGTGVVLDYYISNESIVGSRLGTLKMMWNGGVISSNETSTTDIGDTSLVNLSGSLDGTLVRLQAVNSDIFNYDYKLIHRLL